ncbi:MAG TPA: GAF domain-containing SpoIIE family protein phosphatase [Nonomuraea sp.]|nr:GAF domain-containing SpoIIE family protein phosphatase [Nonomuraea sp.]
MSRKNAPQPAPRLPVVGAPSVERLRAEVQEIAATHQRMHRLMRTVLAIGGTLDLSSVLHAVVDDARSLVDARYGALMLVDARGEGTQLITAGVDPEVHAHVGRLPRGTGLLGEMLRQHRPVRVDDISKDPRAAGFPRGHPILHSLLGVPLQSGGTLYGDLYVADKRSGEPFTQDDEDLVAGLAAAAGVAIANAHLYQDLRSATEEFQRRLLPDRIDVDALDISVRYSPATETPSIGGDWYDVIPFTAGARLLVGDVMGHDLQAAVEMSKLSNMLRVIALDADVPPSRVLNLLDHALEALRAEPIATVLLAQVEERREQRDWRLRWSSAGHLPPLLISPGARAAYLPTDSGPPVGVAADLPRADHEHIIRPGSTLLMFTDGLVERHGATLDHGMDDVARVAERLYGRSPDEICDGLLAHRGDTSEDDIALVCLSIPYTRAPVVTGVRHRTGARPGS